MRAPTTHRQGTIDGLRAVLLLVVAFAAVAGGSLARPATVSAAGPKVVVVVGPTNGMTSTYISRAKVIAAQARSLGASVTEIYTPRATWARVSAAAQGAKLFVYLGHGSGYPSPYTFDKSKVDGMGLNPVDGTGTTTPVKYYGESLIGSTIRFAPRAVVLLNHLCYASGSSEPGRTEPSWTVAKQRVDNYAAGFIAAGAGAVIADAYTDVSYEVRAILQGRNMLSAWRANPFYNHHERSFASVRHAGYTNYLDPDNTSSTFYRAITTKPTFTTATTMTAPAPMRGTTLTAAILRSKPSESASTVTTLAKGTVLTVTAKLATDSKGRTWAPVRTSSGKTGYVAAWLLKFSGTTVASVDVILRKMPSLTATKIELVKAGTRVTIGDTVKDGSLRVWLGVKTPSGHIGWLAAWLMRP
ncbi:MAG TPA: SH3 domain-containing protein [Candidatus Limnocylindrales bacterium]|nr:SH3 domain-containing protein [Candidatus Limnocylindrales bacterium]